MAPFADDAYEFGPFRLETNEPRLLRDGQDVPLPPKALDLLLALVSKAGRLVTKESLLQEVWPGTFVEEANIAYTISLLRKAIEEGDGNQRYIETVPRRGYRFKSEIRRFPADASDGAIAPGSSEHPPHERPPAISEDPRQGKAPRLTAWLLTGLGVTVVVLGTLSVTAVLHRHLAEPAIFSSTARFDVTLPEENFRLASLDRPTVSPDGRRVAFVAGRNGSRQLWIRRLDSAAFQPLAGTEDGFAPFWSPDSGSVGFFAEGKLKRVDVDGGPVLTVCDVPREALAGQWRSMGQRGAWGNSGVIVFSMGRVYRVSDTGGVAQPVTQLDVSPSETQHIVMGFLTDGRRFVFGERSHPGTFFVTSLDSPRDRQILKVGALEDQIDDVLPTQRFLLYAKRGAIIAQPFDELTVRVTGPPTTIADAGWSSPSASRNGLVMFRTGEFPLTLPTWRGRDGSLLGNVGAPDTYVQVELSPTNRRVALVRSGPWIWDADIWLADLASGQFLNATGYPGLESDPQWSADERQLAFTSNQGGTWAPFVKDLVTGREERLIDPQVNLPLDAWTPDGRFLIVRSMHGALYALPRSGERKLQLLTETSHGEDESQVSPNGEWIAFNTTSPPRPEVYVARFPGLNDKRQVSMAGGMQPKWRRDGRELFYLAPDGTMMTIGITSDGQFPFMPARPLFKTALGETPSGDQSQYDVSSDGQRFLILERKREPVEKFTFLVNWSHGLKD